MVSPNCFFYSPLCLPDTVHKAEELGVGAAVWCAIPQVVVGRGKLLLTFLPSFFPTFVASGYRGKEKTETARGTSVIILSPARSLDSLGNLMNDITSLPSKCSCSQAALLSWDHTDSSSSLRPISKCPRGSGTYG